jgi:hypothetical protein
MSTQTVRSATRPAKIAKGAAKKPAKSSRPVSGKSAKSAKAAQSRQPVATVKQAVPVDRIIRPVSAPVAPPRAAVSLPRRLHKYEVGEAVYFTTPSFGRAAATGSYTVVKLLPSEGDDYQYRIKSTGEAFERVAKESQLERV